MSVAITAEADALNRDVYRAFCASEATLPVFMQAWWLDATVGAGNWGVSLAQSDHAVVGALPYVRSRGRCFTRIGMPPLTPYLGPWIRSDGGPARGRLAKEKDVLEQLHLGLPEHDSYSQAWSHHRTNWLPFFWRGYTQTTLYTYRLESPLDETALWSNLQSNIRTDIRKATGRCGLTVRTDCDMGEFLALHRSSFVRQGVRCPYSDVFLQTIDAYCTEHQCRRLIIAEDSDGKQHAGVYVVWDSRDVYYLMGGGDPELRTSGASSLCVWEAIRFAASIGRSFDFEGSMLEPVERFFRAFGAVQTPYSLIERTPSRLLRLRRAIGLACREMGGG